MSFSAGSAPPAYGATGGGGGGGGGGHHTASNVTVSVHALPFYVPSPSVINGWGRKIDMTV